MRFAPLAAACLILASSAARADSLGPYIALRIVGATVEASAPKADVSTTAERTMMIHRGSGVVVGPAKSGGWLVLTNAHVVREAGKESGPEAWAAGGWRPGRVLGVDEAADLALIAVKSPEPLRVAKIATSPPPDGVSVKTRAFAGGTKYTARAAELRYALPLKDGRTGRTAHTYFVDTAFVPGESGGAVVLDGRLVGLIYATDMSGETPDSADDRGWGLCVDHPSIVAFLARFGRRSNVAAAPRPEAKKGVSGSAGGVGIEIPRVGATAARPPRTEPVPRP